MEENTDNNKILDFENAHQELEFKYNFINMPWDDRTRKSKTWIIILLVSIFVVTMALVANNFYLHYKRFKSVKLYTNSDINCYRIRLDELPYVARLQSATTYELVCLGAVVSPTSVLANGLCLKFGQLRMYVGSTSDPRCRKGFSVDVTESIHHPEVNSKRLVLLSSYENIEQCSIPIIIGHKLNWDMPVDIIGRPYSNGRTLSKQHITLAYENLEESVAENMRSNYNCSLMGKDIARCPVRAGDLLLQNGKLFGLAASQHNKLAFFAHLECVKRDLKEIDVDITIENNIYRSRIPA